MVRIVATIFIILISFTGLTACGVTNEGGNDVPDIPGKLVLSAKDDAGTYQIYTMKANGTHLKQLTHFSTGGGVNPVWSPDGKRIAFANFTNATTLGPYLYIMDADGNNMRPLKRRSSEALKALVGNYLRGAQTAQKLHLQNAYNVRLSLIII